MLPHNRIVFVCIFMYLSNGVIHHAQVRVFCSLLNTKETINLVAMPPPPRTAIDFYFLILLIYIMLMQNIDNEIVYLAYKLPDEFIF